MNLFISQKTRLSFRKIIFIVCPSYSQKKEIFFNDFILTISNFFVSITCQILRQNQFRDVHSFTNHK